MRDPKLLGPSEVPVVFGKETGKKGHRHLVRRSDDGGDKDGEESSPGSTRKFFTFDEGFHRAEEESVYAVASDKHPGPRKKSKKKLWKS